MQPSAPAPRTPSRGARLRPKLGALDLLLQLWRAKWLMLLVFMSVFLAGVIITLMIPTKFEASTRLFVRLGQEEAFDPAIGADAPRGLLPPQAAMQAEIELVLSPELAERVLTGIGVARLYPKLAEARLRARDRGVYIVDQRLRDAFAADLKVASAPGSSILRLSYAHEDPTLAAATLNRFSTEYLQYRQEVLFGKGVAGLAEQRDVIEGRLVDADTALRDFLTRNSLTDFDAEAAAARKQFADISEDLTQVQISLRELGAGRATSRTLTVRASALAAQKREAEGRIAHLAGIETDYLRLKRDRDALQASANAFAARQQAELTRNELGARSAGNVSVYEAARVPTGGDATKPLIAITAAILGLVAALVTGLLSALSVTGLATAHSTERTLGLRVLATAKDHAT